MACKMMNSKSRDFFPSSSMFKMTGTDLDSYPNSAGYITYLHVMPKLTS